jgi:hypothetical protein
MADAPSTPSFPYDGPFRPQNQGGTENEAIITLSSDSTSLKVNDQFTVDITIATDANVKSYSLVITYDTSKLTAVDQDTSTSEIQIKYLDTYNQSSANTININSSTKTGTITLSAAVPSGSSASSINRRVAQMTFKATGSGSASVSVNEGSSNVTDEDGTNILSSVTNAQFTITAQATSSSSSSVSSSSSSASSSSSLPTTGLFDVTSTAGSILAGVVLLFIGAKTLIKRKKESFWPK